MINTNLFELITEDNISELKEGEWIWDNKPIERREHRLSLDSKTIVEPIGFRLIHVLDVKLYPRWSSKPFMLSSIDGYRQGYEWTYFDSDRFYRIKKESKNDR